MTSLIQIFVSLPAFVSVLLKITVVLGVGWIFQFSLARCNPRWRVLLWRGVIVGVVLVPALVPLRYLQISVSPPVEPVIAEQTHFVSEYPMTEPSGVLPMESHSVPGPREQDISKPSFSSWIWMRESIWAMVLSVWALVVVTLGSRLLVGYVRIKKQVGASLPGPEDLQLLLDQVASDLGCSRRVALRYSPDMVTPFLTGFHRPILVLPERMIGKGYAVESPAIFAHEVAHLLAGDLFWMFAARLFGVVMWFHPLVWKLRNNHNKACEAVCDAVAVDYVGSAESYSSTLARVALDVVGIAPTVGGIPMARSSEILGRLKMLKRKIYSSPLARRWVALSVLTGLAVLISLGSIKLVYADDKQSDEHAGQSTLDEKTDVSAAAENSKTSTFNVRLPNGVTVELLALWRGINQDERQWWRPDGTVMSKEESTLYEHKATTPAWGNEEFEFEYGYLVKFTPFDDLASNTNVTIGQRMSYKYPSEDGISAALVASDAHERKKGFAEIGDIKVAAAYGPTKSFVSRHGVAYKDGDLHMLEDRTTTVIVSPTRPDRYEPDRGLMIDTTVNAGDLDIKVFYESKDGNIRNAWSDGTMGGPSLLSRVQRPNTMIQSTFRLHSVQQDQLRSIIVEYRRFKGAAFKNVALRPGVKTTVTTELIRPPKAALADRSTKRRVPPEHPSTAPTKPIAALSQKPLNPESTVDLDNGTSVELLGLTHFEGGELKWWAPDGRPLKLPWVTKEDMKHKGNIAAFRFYGSVDSFKGYYLIASSMHEIKERWQVGSGIWLGVLGYPEERNFGKLYFRTTGSPGQTLFTIPITSKDLKKRRTVNQFGVNKIQTFEPIDSGGFAIELLHKDRLAGDRFAAVDVSGKTHEYSYGYSTRNRSYMKYQFPPEDVASIVRQKMPYAAAKFDNVSLQGKSAKVVTGARQFKESSEPEVDISVDRKFTAVMPNGVEVGLLAVGRLAGDTLKWWTPEGKPADVPGVLECDVEGWPTVIAFKVRNANGFTEYLLQDSQLNRIENSWYVRSRKLWMVALEDLGDTTSAHLVVRAFGGQWEPLLEIPLAGKDSGQEVEINQQGFDKVAEFNALTPDSFRIKITHSKEHKRGEWVTVDKQGKTYGHTSGGFSYARTELTFPLSAEQLAKIVLRRQQAAQATFRNISLKHGHRTEVQIDTKQVDSLDPHSSAQPGQRPFLKKRSSIASLEKLKGMDKLYTSGLTLTGTDLRVPGYSDVPSQKIKWKLSIQPGEFALAQEPIEIYERKTKEPPAQFKGTSPTMMMKRVVYIGPKRSGHHFVFGDVLGPGKTPKLEENMKSGQVLLRAGDSEYFILAKLRYLWSLGRGYSDYLDVITAINQENGVVTVEAEGRGLNQNRGLWKLKVDPGAMYMIQAAEFRSYDPHGKLQEKADVIIANSGVKWFGSLCVPEQATLSGFGRNQAFPITCDSLIPEPDVEFLKEANQFLDPPYRVPTSYSNSGVDRLFKPGEIFEN